MTAADFVSKRSASVEVACGILWALSDNQGQYVPWAICGIIVMTTSYLIAEGIKQWRNPKEVTPAK